MLVLQMVTVVAILAAVALYPPAKGTMILVPIWPGADRGLAAHAIEAGAQLVDAGPLPHSLVVSGVRAMIAPVMLSRGVLIVTAPASGCGVKK